MSTEIKIINTKPWCPSCDRGYMFLREVVLETCPEVEPDVLFRYTCNRCPAHVDLYMNELVDMAIGFIGISTIRTIWEKRHK